MFNIAELNENPELDDLIDGKVLMTAIQLLTSNNHDILYNCLIYLKYATHTCSNYSNQIIEIILPHLGLCNKEKIDFAILSIYNNIMAIDHTYITNIDSLINTLNEYIISILLNNKIETITFDKELLIKAIITFFKLALEFDCFNEKEILIEKVSFVFLCFTRL